MDSLEMLATNTEVPYHRSSTNSCENELEIIGQEQPSIHTNPYVNAGFEECEKNGGGSKSDPFLAKGCTKTWHGGTDDGLVYANLSEIARRKELEAIDRRPYPPFPDATAQPLRIIANGWREYRTQGGRSYYFHPENGICQWKPPRNTIIGRALLQQFESNSSPNEAVHENCAASTSTGSTEFFAEIPLHRDMMMRKSENGRQGSSNNFDIHKSAVAECLENINTAKKEIMSHSLDGGMNHHQAESGKDDPATALYDTPANVSTPPHQHQQRGAPIKHGLLDKCRLTENGVKVKRKDWCSAYAYLYIGHLLFYKDQKSAEKTGKHYPAPTDVCDLRNAIISYIENDKQRDKRRKYIISLILISNTEYNLSCGGGDDHEIQDWYNALRQAITTMSTSKISTITNPPIVIEYNGSLQRSIRHKRGGGGGDKDTFGTFSSKSTLHNSIKSRLKTSSTSKTISSEDHFSVCTENSAIESSPPAKATIIERLLRFFRTRPTMESLREKGIYKPEPVFGSTLGEICTREKSLVPKFITEVTALIEQKGIDSDGLYRVNGNLSSVQKIRCQIDQDFYDAMRNEEDIHVLSGALKLFLRELGEPIFPVSMHKDFMSAMRESGNKRFRSIDELLLRMPPVNKETLRVLITHLNRVATNSGKNRMQVHNLAIIFGPSLFCSEDRTGHLRKPSQDKGGKGGGGGSKRKSLDKRGPAEDVQQQQQQPTGPTQNLAYRMIVYGQILEFVLSESERLTIFRGPT